MRHQRQLSNAQFSSLATIVFLMNFFKVESAQSDNPAIHEVSIDNDNPDQAIMANFSLIELLENQILGKSIKVVEPNKSYIKYTILVI